MIFPEFMATPYSSDLRHPEVLFHYLLLCLQSRAELDIQRSQKEKEGMYSSVLSGPYYHTKRVVL